MKNKAKTFTLTVLAFLAVFALISAYNAHKDAQMNAYAEANNCTWHATGTFYGDSRDFICKQRETRAETGPFSFIQLMVKKV